MSKAFRSLLCSFLLLLFCSPLLGQSCAMCKTAVAAQMADVIRAFNLGILVLAFPPVMMMSGILCLAFWRRD